MKWDWEENGRMGRKRKVEKVKGEERGDTDKHRETVSNNREKGERREELIVGSC